MSDWSRRSVLAAIGLAPLVPACGAALRGSEDATAIPQSLAATRVRLRELVASMQSRFPYAAALAQVRRHDRAVADGTESSVQRDQRVVAVFTVVDEAGIVHERATNDMSSDGLVRAAADLLGTSDAKADFAEPQDLPTIGARIAPRGGGWLDRASGVFERSRRHGGSRIVYRSAYFDADDTESVFVGSGRDIGQRVVRLRAGVAFVAAAGVTTYVDVAERAGTIGVRAARVSDTELAEAADGALALLTARPAQAGEYDVVLDPSCSALLAAHGIGPALTSDRWRAGDSAAALQHQRRVGSEHVHLVDDPTLNDGYGSYAFDDEGRGAAPVRLIDAGVLTNPLCDRVGAAQLGVPPTANGRRATFGAPVRPTPSNLYFAGGSAANSSDLIGGVEAGMLLEGALAASGDPARWSCQMRIARGREIKDGKLTGRLYGPLLLHGDVPSLLTAVAGATARVQHLPIAPGISAGGPFVLTRARLAGM